MTLYIPRRFVFALFALIFFFAPVSVSAYYTNMPASVVVGQQDFTSGSANQGGSAGTNTINNPSGFWSDGNKLIVSDQTNHRVLIYNSIPSSNNASADVVIGQQDFTSTTADQGVSAGANTLDTPRGVCSDGTKLLVVDNNNNRVLVYNTIPTSNNASAGVVIGQTNFSDTSVNQGGPNAINGLRGPRSCFVDENGKLYISDTLNYRVLIYNSIPSSNNASADVVIGQETFSTATQNLGGLSASSLFNPGDVRVDGSKLYITDQSNNRVLIYNSIPTSNKPSADVVIGQPNFALNSDNQGVSVNANTLFQPRGLYVSNGRIFIGDLSNHRVLIYNSIPTSNNASADVVLGQTSFTGSSANQGGSVASNTLFGPGSNSVYVVGNKLLIADTSNNRLLIFNNIIATPKLNMDTPPQDIGGGKLRVKGNILLGERTRYSMQWMKASVNGDNPTNVTYLDGGRDDGPGESRYEWYNDFTSQDQYTLKVTASSFNADQSTLFYFSPFNLLSFTDGTTQTVKFSLPTKYIQSIKDNTDHFEVWTRAFDDGWKMYVPNIPTSLINSTSGEVEYSFSRTNTKGKYDIKVVSVSKDSNWRFDSNILTKDLGGSPGLPLGIVANSSSPLQINNVAGSIVSSYNPTGIKEKYTLTSKTPIFKGIAYANSKVTMLVTNNLTNLTRTYSVTVSPDSTFTISPILFPNSTITVYLVDPLGKFAVLPSFGTTLY